MLLFAIYKNIKKIMFLRDGYTFQQPRIKTGGQKDEYNGK